jgi:hypothetical protein
LPSVNTAGKTTAKVKALFFMQYKPARVPVRDAGFKAVWQAIDRSWKVV